MNPQQQTGNPIHAMDDSELLSRYTLADVGSPEFKKYRDEILYRMRDWTRPPRLSSTQAKGGR